MNMEDHLFTTWAVFVLGACSIVIGVFALAFWPKPTALDIATFVSLIGVGVVLDLLAVVGALMVRKAQKRFMDVVGNRRVKR